MYDAYENLISNLRFHGPTDRLMLPHVACIQMEIVSNETNVGIYSNTVDLSFLPPGTYLAVLRNEEKTTTKKAVKTN